jgi:hypothetical protein
MVTVPECSKLQPFVACSGTVKNGDSNTALDRPLSDKARPHVTYSQPTHLYGQPISFVWQHTLPYLGSVVKLSMIVRGRTIINWPS